MNPRARKSGTDRTLSVGLRHRLLRAERYSKHMGLGGCSSRSPLQRLCNLCDTSLLLGERFQRLNIILRPLAANAHFLFDQSIIPSSAFMAAF